MELTFEEEDRQLLERVIQKDEEISEKYPPVKGHLDSPAMGERKHLHQWWSNERKKLKEKYRMN